MEYEVKVDEQGYEYKVIGEMVDGKVNYFDTPFPRIKRCAGRGGEEANERCFYFGKGDWVNGDPNGKDRPCESGKCVQLNVHRSIRDYYIPKNNPEALKPKEPDQRFEFKINWDEEEKEC